MRAGLLEAALLVPEQHYELACGTGGDQYRQILSDFRVMIRSCPEQILVLIEQHMLVDFGSHFKAADEVTEEIHHWLKMLLGKACPNPDVFRSQMREFSVRLREVSVPSAIFVRGSSTGI